jgi:hypothetical protein
MTFQLFLDGLDGLIDLDVVHAFVFFLSDGGDFFSLV